MLAGLNSTITHKNNGDGENLKVIITRYHIGRHPSQMNHCKPSTGNRNTSFAVQNTSCCSVRLFVRRAAFICHKQASATVLVRDRHAVPTSMFVRRRLRYAVGSKQLCLRRIGEEWLFKDAPSVTALSTEKPGPSSAITAVPPRGMLSLCTCRVESS